MIPERVEDGFHRQIGKAERVHKHTCRAGKGKRRCAPGRGAASILGQHKGIHGRREDATAQASVRVEVSLSSRNCSGLDDPMSCVGALFCLDAGTFCSGDVEAFSEVASTTSPHHPG